MIAEETPFHADEEMLAAFTAGELDPIDCEILESHLSDCARCAWELDELRKFQAIASSYPKESFAPAEAPTAAKRLASFLARPWFVAPLAAAGAAAALFFGLIQPLNTSLEGQQARARALEEQNRQLVAGAEDVQRQTQELARLQGEAARTQAEAAAARERSAKLEAENKRLKQLSSQKVAPATASGPTLRDGATILVKQPDGRMAKLVPLEPKIDKALQTGAVEKPLVLAMLLDQKAMVRGAEVDAFSVTSPAATVVREVRPRFVWTPLPDATAYVVHVYDAKSREIIASSPVNATEWTPSKALPRGQLLQWEVVALKGEEEVDKAPAPPAKAARFQILKAEEEKQLATLARERAGSNVSLGVEYASRGLLDDAERALSVARQENPGSEIVEKLWASVRKLRGRTP